MLIVKILLIKVTISHVASKRSIPLTFYDVSSCLNRNTYFTFSMRIFSISFHFIEIAVIITIKMYLENNMKLIKCYFECSERKKRKEIVNIVTS